MERDKTFQQSQEEKIVGQASILVEYLTLSLDADTIEAVVRGGKPEGTKNRLERLQQEMAELKYRRSHAFELPPYLRKLDRGISLDENTQGIRERLLSVFRTKPLTEAESERLEILRWCFKIINTTEIFRKSRFLPPSLLNRT